MNEDEILGLLALQKTKGVGDILAKKLISHCGSPLEIFKENKASLQKINGIGAAVIKSIFDKKNFCSAENELKYIQSNNIDIHYYQDSLYPEKLKHCVDGPIALFADGKIDLCNKKIISIVGTRKMTLLGKTFLEQFIEDLKGYNPIIVSGFAYGVDIAAHKSAIKNNLQTIGVLAHGFETIYPKVHKKYISEVHKNGGFLTEFWHDEPPHKENFLKRNRIVAGISQATIIIESAEKGGSLVTADIANSYDRDVFAVPGRVSDPLSKGCNMLIKQNKAGMITTAKDLIAELNWADKQQPSKLIQQELFVDLSTEELLVFEFLKKNGKSHIDIIASNCNLPTYKIATLLFNIEMKGIISPFPGKLYACT